MTSSLSGTTDLRKLRRPTMGWATALVALGVFAGIITAFVARGEGLATAAAFVDPSHTVTADVAKVAAAQPQPQAQAPVMMPGAAAVQVSQQKPAAPACNADAVAPAKVEAKVVEAKVETKEPAPAKVETKEPAPAKVEKVVVVQRPVYTAPVRRAEPAAREVAAAAPPPAVTKPAAKAVRRGGDDMESASAADALAKAQLEAALSR